MGMFLCERCLEDAIEKTATETRYGTPLCDACATAHDEAACEAADRKAQERQTVAEGIAYENALSRAGSRY